MRSSKLFKNLRRQITIYDLLIFILALGFLVFLSFSFKEKPASVRVGVKIWSPRWWSRNTIPPYWLADAISVGDKEIDVFGKPVAEVKDIQVFETSDNVKDVYLTVGLAANHSKKTGKYTFKGQPVEVGAPIELHLGNTFIQGLVTFVSKEQEVQDELIVTGKMINTKDGRGIYPFPWEAEAVNVGDKMTDGQGRVVAEIVDRRIKLPDHLTTDALGNVHVRKNPLKRDATFKIKIKVSRRGDNYYFRGEQKVKVGEKLFLQFESGDIDYLSIIKIEK
ncbi:MAG: hypothetical protein ACC618_03710 [Patescibacteria group bacterium]